jgi:hypothetical protein
MRRRVTRMRIAIRGVLVRSSTVDGVLGCIWLSLREKGATARLGTGL